MEPVNLIEHPEGGRFAEVFRSGATVTTAAGESRSAITHIYFSLNQGEVSKFHKVKSDEVWSLYQGEGVYLYTLYVSGTCCQRHELSARSNIFCHVVPAGVWQAAEPVGGAVLVECSVGPGFIQRIELTVFTDNEPAIALYKKRSFCIEGESANYAFRGGQFVGVYHMARIK